MLYEVSSRHYFRENGRTLLPGQTIELAPEQASAHNRGEPGLLKPVRVTTQGHAESVRQDVSQSQEVPEKKPRGRKPKK